jgi:peptidoglycan/LPS O-acetylase OafA/YrhL/ABC-type sugar transport system permease subunit
MLATLKRALRREQHLPYLYVAPAVLVLLVFGLLPVLFTGVVSLLGWDPTVGLREVAFEPLRNYLWALTGDPKYDFLLGATLWHALISTFVIHVSAIPLAVFVNRAFRRTRAGVLALYFLPFLTGGIVVEIMVRAFFSSSETGVVNAALTTLGNVTVLGVKPLALFFPTHPVDWWFQHGPAIGVLVAWWYGLGWNVLLYVTALQYVPRSLEEAARIDGANALQTLLYVIVPQLRPMIFFAGSLTVVGETLDGGPFSLAAYLSALAYHEGEFGPSAAESVVMVLALAGIIYGLWAWVGGRPSARREPRREAEADAAPARVRWGRRARTWLARKLAAPEPADPTALRGLNGLRALACLAVIFHHLFQRLDGQWALILIFKPIWVLGITPGFGVTSFFVLSGALLSMPFWRRFLRNDPPPPLGAYALRRAARIFPGYWLALGAAVLVGTHVLPEAQQVVRRLVAGLTFTTPFHYVTFFPAELDPPLWTISFEVVCYVLLPLLVLPMWRAVPDRSPRRAMRYLAWVIVGLQLAHLAIVALFPTDEVDKGWTHGLLGGAKTWLPYWNPATFMTQFLLGGAAALAICWRQQVQPRRSTDWDTLTLWVLLAACVVHAMVGGGQASFLTRQPYFTPVFPALLAFALFAMQFGDWVARGLDNRLLNFVAKYSFGLFLWHYPVIELIRMRWIPEFKNFQMRSVPQWMGLSALVLAISFALAWLSWHLVEQPVVRWARARGARPVAVPPEVTP